jgi:predicted dehydrogenase
MNPTRRAVLGALTTASYSRILGANDRVRLGFIGYGLIGKQHVSDFRKQPDADCAALAEVHTGRLDEGITACGGRAKPYRDFRKLLDDKDLDAVVLSTPDHWHAAMTILACAAGKDVYVEKPMTVFVREGRWMVQAARKYRRVVQVGTQQRSGQHYHKAIDLMRAGAIGDVHNVRIALYRNAIPGFGSQPDSAAPSGFDYDLWLGPAPKRPYNLNRSLYHFRWFWDYSGGQMTNWGAHDIDVVQWYLRSNGPRMVSSMGGRWSLQDNGETPDTQDATFYYDSKLVLQWSMREAVHVWSPAGEAGVPKRVKFESCEFYRSVAGLFPEQAGGLGRGFSVLFLQAGWFDMPADCRRRKDPLPAVSLRQAHVDDGLYARRHWNASPDFIQSG